MYTFIYKFFSFQFNSNLMLWLEETDDNVKPQPIVVDLDLAVLLILNGSGLPVAQLFLQRLL